MSGRFGAAVLLDYHPSAPAAPAAGVRALYAKTNGLLYTKDSAGTETLVTHPNLEDTGWIAATLLNGWTNYGGGYAPAQYRRINGVVYLQGLLAPGTFTAQTPVVSALPAGYRPAERQLHTCIAGFAGQNTGLSSAGTSHLHYAPTNQITIRMDVLTDGSINLGTAHAAGGSGRSSPAHIDLFGIRYLAEA